MIKGKIIYIILGIIVLTALLLRLFSKEDNWVCTNGSWVKHGSPMMARPSSSCPGGATEAIEQFILEGASTSTAPATTTSETETTQVIINLPQPEAIISSPLVVKGEARGNWFFEASLPVKLLNDKREVMASTAATAEGDWMTTSFVPFSALLEFETTATSGYLVIAKDNPSGLSENDASFEIPVKFLNK